MFTYLLNHVPISKRSLLSFIFLSGFIYSSKAQSIEGLWQSKGYGFAFGIQDSIATIFDVTSISALLTNEDSFVKEDSFFLSGTYFGDFVFVDSQLTLQRTDGNVFIFEPVDSLENLLTEPSQDPSLIFDILWQTHAEYSAILSILDIDWEQIRDSLRVQITDTTTQEELFSLCEQLLEPLNDGHTSLVDFENGVGFGGGPDVNPYWFIGDGAPGSDLLNAIIGNYLKGNFSITESNQIIYGSLEDSIGYLLVGSFSDYASEDANDFENDEAFRKEFLEGLEALKDHKALILDMRFNGGGSDLLARSLASHFTTERKLAYTKQARSGDIDEFLEPPISFYIEPQEDTYFEDRSIVVLTSQQTASAAEIFLLSIQQIPNIMTLGEPSYGIFSDAIPKFLPNGWFFTFSPERYLSFEGINYEQVRIPADIEELGDTALFATGRDNMIERAIQELEALTTSIQSVEFFAGPSRVFPNPIEDQFQLEFTLPNPSKLSFSLYDVSGRVIQKRLATNFAEGRHRLDWDMSGLNAGIYLLQVQTPSQALSHTLIKN